MPVKIVIPEPTSSDPDYNQRSLEPYLVALSAAGAEPIVFPLHEYENRATDILADAQGVLLPGSRYDVDPRRYGEEPIPECSESDTVRASVDELLLQHAFSLRKPILAICHGAQTLNVWRHGKLTQDLKTAVNHRPGREVVEAHTIRVARGSRLAGLLSKDASTEIQVNSSHYQATRVPGDDLCICAVSPVDGVIEAVELDSPGHFVLAVQWHPERTYTQNAFSREIFAAFVRAAAEWKMEEQVAQA